MGDNNMANSRTSFDDDYSNDPESPEDTHTHQNEHSHDSKPGSPDDNAHTGDSSSKPSVPMQKRRRVTRACDECRRKKIKCDGKQPCTHCTVYSYECTYDQPSNRRRNPAPQYIEALEHRVQKAEAILRFVLPGVDIDDPKFDARSVEQIVESSKHSQTANSSKPTDDDGQIQPMVDRIGSLDLDDDGKWDFHGHSSGYAFMRRFRAQFGEQFLPDPRTGGKPRMVGQVFDSPRSIQSSPYEISLAPGVDLPPKETAIELCRNALDDCCALMRPLHRPTFFRRLNAIYSTDPEHYTNDHTRFLPLLYVVMALGCLFQKTENEHGVPDLKGYKEAIEYGYQYLNAGKQMLDITDCRDLITIQTIFFMILFLQSSAKLAVCYAYIGIALRACCRLGLHRNIPHHFNSIEKEERKRIFWLVRKTDIYVGCMIGLPQMLSDDDIDQELPAEVHDDFILEDGIRAMPSGTFPLLKATNAHTKLTNILRKVVRYIYPIKTPGNHQSINYTISHGKIRELERDLQTWMDELPMELRPTDNAGPELARVQQLLRISYAHVQMMMYRPFIHYVSQACQQGKADKRSFACAAACVSVARNIVHITSEMKRRGLLVGAYWFVMYTTYFAILSLVYFVLENPDSPTGQDILKDAVEGRDTLASLAKRSLAADRCTQSLAFLFTELPDKLKERRGSQQTPPTTSKKRPPPAADPSPIFGLPKASNPSSTGREPGVPPARARTLPHDYLANVAKRNSVPDQKSSFGFGESPKTTKPHLLGLNSPSTSSSFSTPLNYTPQMDVGHLPDMNNVMFPSDNPFTYPNQPISTLESMDSQFGLQDMNIEAFSGSNENSMFGTPTSMPSQNQNKQYSEQQQQHSRFDLPNFEPVFGPNASIAQQMAQQGRHFSAPMSGFGPGSSMIDMTSSQEPTGMGAMPAQLPQEDYWSQLTSGNIGGRTGFTPGPSVNLDELFGGDGWNGIWNEQGFAKQIG